MKKYKSLIFPAICLYISIFLYHIIVDGWGLDTTEPFLMSLLGVLTSIPSGFISYFKKSWTFIGTLRRMMIILAIYELVTVVIVLFNS